MCVELFASRRAFLKDIAPGCDFMAVNFETRLTNRQAEMDGLKKVPRVESSETQGRTRL